ncbi:MAG: hypothetical protein WCD79_09720 [Chthoniobacteraceae bacterium]
MGTGGLGGLEYHIADAKWSRYDIKKDATPGHAMTILYADDDYVFAGYSKLYVYSVQKDQWFEIAQVSTKGASLGRSGMGTQMVYDLSHYATEKYIPTNQPVGSLNLFGMPSSLRYDAETGEYVLSYGGQALVNMDEQHGPKPTILHIKKSDLAR